MRRIVVFLAFAVAAIAVLALPARGEDARTGAATWVKAPTCCAGCKYPNNANCCCAKRDSIPVTSTKRVFKGIAGTKKLVATATFTKTIVKKARKQRRDLGEVVSEPATEAAVEQIDHELFGRQAGRHLCPVCPPGVKLATGKTSGRSAQGCCPKRRTVKKTITAKRWITKYTKTTTKMATVAIKGKLLNKKKRAQKNVLIKIVGPSSKKRLAIRQEAAVIVGTDLTAADGTFSIVGAALPGELDVFAGNTSIGTVTVEPTGAVEDGGDLGTVVEAPIATFVPQCELPSATVISTGTVLAKASLIGADFTAVEKAPDVDSATLTKSSALVNDINIVDGYYELGSYIGLNDAAIKIKLTPPTGKKIVIAGFGIKSTAFSPEREGFRFSVGAEEPGVPVQDSTTFYWEGGCPDDGQLHQVTLSVTYETQWDVPIVSLFLRNNQTIGKWRFEDFEIYGSVVDPTAPTVTTDGPGAATTEAPTGTEATVTTAEIPTTAATTTTTGIACETPGDLPSNFQQWGGLFTLFMHLTDVPSSVADTRFISNVNTWGSGLSRERANDFLVVTSNASAADETAAEAAGTVFKIEFETNTNFSIRAIQLLHTHDPTVEKNTTLKFFYDVGDGVKLPVQPVGQFTWAAGCPSVAHHSSYYQHWIVVPFLSPITKYTFYIYHLGEAGNSIKYNSIIAQGNWCDTQGCTLQ